MEHTDTDRIEKKIILKAPRARVWRALTSVDEFNSWFRVALEGTFASGATLRGAITYDGYEHMIMDVVVDALEPERLIAWSWHAAWESEARTMVTFTLEDVDGGTLLTLVESGFNSLPAKQRAEAYRGNSQGWDEQMTNIERHLREVA